MAADKIDLPKEGQIAIEVSKAIDRGLIDGPRIRAAGRVVTMTGGHGHFIGRDQLLDLAPGGGADARDHLREQIAVLQRARVVLGRDLAALHRAHEGAPAFGERRHVDPSALAHRQSAQDRGQLQIGRHVTPLTRGPGELPSPEDVEV